MKRVLCMLLAMVIVAGLAGCQENLSPEEEQLVETFLEDWMKLLTLREKLLAQENHALELMIRAGEEPTWESVVYARTACGYTCQLIAHLGETKLKPSLTTEDYRTLMELGMDLQDVEAEFRTYNENTVPSLAVGESAYWNGYFLQNLLYWSVEEATTELVAESARIKLRINQCELKWQYLLNNYIMLELPEAYARRLEQEALEKAPHVMQQYGIPFSSTREVLNEMDRVYEAMKEEKLESEANNTRWELLMEDPVWIPRQMEGLPQLLPFPEMGTLDSWQLQDYWKQGDEIRTADYLMEPDTLPNCMFLYAQGVELADYQRYVLELKAEGLTPGDMNETAALYSLEDGCQLMVYYEDGTFTISVTGGQIAFVPRWYLDAVA